MREQTARKRTPTVGKRNSSTSYKCQKWWNIYSLSTISLKVFLFTCPLKPVCYYGYIFFCFWFICYIEILYSTFDYIHPQALINILSLSAQLYGIFGFCFVLNIAFLLILWDCHIMYPVILTSWSFHVCTPLLTSPPKKNGKNKIRIKNQEKIVLSHWIICIILSES